MAGGGAQRALDWGSGLGPVLPLPGPGQARETRCRRTRPGPRAPRGSPLCVARLAGRGGGGDQAASGRVVGPHPGGGPHEDVSPHKRPSGGRVHRQGVRSAWTREAASARHWSPSGSRCRSAGCARRYVQFLSGLLAGTVKMNAAPLFLHLVVLHGTPSFDAGGGERPCGPVGALPPPQAGGLSAQGRAVRVGRPLAHRGRPARDRSGPPTAAHSGPRLTPLPHRPPPQRAGPS